MTISALDLLKNPATMTIKINGTEFTVPKIVIDREFITANVHGFEDVHDYYIETDTDPQVIFDEILEYITVLYDDCYVDTEDSKILYLSISPATSVFIDMYLKDHAKLLDWVCWKYSRIIGNEFGSSASILHDIVHVFAGWFDVDAEIAEILEMCIKKEFPDLLEKLNDMINDTETIKKVFDFSTKEHFEMFMEMSLEYEMFLSRLLRTYIEFHGIVIEHAIPNNRYDEPRLIFDHENQLETTERNKRRSRVSEEYVMYGIKPDDTIIDRLNTKKIKIDLKNKFKDNFLYKTFYIVAHEHNSAIKTSGVLLNETVKQRLNIEMYDNCVDCFNKSGVYFSMSVFRHNYWTGYVNIVNLNNGVIIFMSMVEDLYSDEYQMGKVRESNDSDDE